MKKSLMMAIAASTVLFAGGDIAPVQPVAEAPAAACDDFYGQAAVGVQYVTVKTNGVKTAEDVRYGVAAILGVTKEIFSGVTLNAEVQGGYFDDYNVMTKAKTAHMNVGAFTQLNLGYSFCNTAFKAGRFTIPESLSPLVYTGTNHLGLKTLSADGVLVANTDLPDTTLWASYIRHVVSHVASYPAPAIPFIGSSTTTEVNIVAGGFKNTSFADTVITAAAYYDLAADGAARDAFAWKYMVAGSIDHKWCDTDISVGAAYRKYDTAAAVAAEGASAYIIGGSIKQSFSAGTLTLGATYTADPDTANDAANNVNSMRFHKFDKFTMQSIIQREGWAIGAKATTDWCGYKLNAWGAYNKQKDYAAGAGISKTFKGINFAVDYRYVHNDALGVAAAKTNAQRIRAKAVYKF